MTNELLNPCHLTHLVAKDVQLQSLVVLTLKFHVIIDFGMTCKVHVIST
jgi:hypothetical protein